MKLSGYIAALVISVCPFLYSQSLGISAGYGALKMKDVNRSMEYSQRLFSGSAIYSEPEEIKSGLFLEGSFKYRIGMFNTGILVDYISSSGGYRYSGFFNEHYDVNTTELLGLVEFLMGKDSYLIRPFVKAAGGIGFASAKYTLDFRFLTIDHPLSGNYFAARFEGGFQVYIHSVTLEFAAGYRIADPRGLRGDRKLNGYTFYNALLTDIYGAPIEFDYSGFIIRGGIAVQL